MNRANTFKAFLPVALIFSVAATANAQVPGSNGMVVTSQHLASEVGVEILKQGGNAVDAAVAVGYALAVVEPCCGNIGGGGFATIRLADGRETFVNFREKAPLAATRDMYVDANGEVIPRASLDGYRSVGVPGTVLGLETMRAKYGTMDRERLMAPAIGLAENGFVLDAGDEAEMRSRRFIPGSNIADIFLNDGQLWKSGERLVQKNLAATLRLVSTLGPDAFYKGPIAEAVVAASDVDGGILTVRDFAEYNVTESAPVHCSYRGYELLSSPPPSSGGTTLCEILNILEAYPMGALGYHSAPSVHLMTEAMRHAYVDRNFSLGDPAFVKNPIERLLSQEHAAAIRARILPDKATPSSELQFGIEPHEGNQTTHFSIVDKDGNAVSLTYTINNNFGARVIAGNTGFFLNDEMDDFTTKPGAPNYFRLVQGENNAIAPGKRPLSSMSSTIVTRDGKVFMVTGSPGGSRIITITLGTILNVIDYSMDIQKAVDAPRLHHQWLPDQISAEPGALTPEARQALEAMGYTIREQGHWGSAEAILVDPKQNGNNGGFQRFWGATDPRRKAGAAVGY